LLVSRKTVTDTVGDKRAFGRLAKQVGVEGIVVPRTFENAAEAIETLANPTRSSNSKLVFVKTTSGSGGKEVDPVATNDLAAFLTARGGLKRGELIQEGVEGLALHDGKKLVIRSFFIVYGGALYVSHHTIAIVHGLKFDASKATHEVHVDHNHPDTIMGGVDDIIGPANGAKWRAAIIKAARLAGPMFERVVAETAADNLRYHVFGVDVLPRNAGDVMFVESNIFPYMPNKSNKVEMALAVFRLLFGVQKGGGDEDDELTKVWEWSAVPSSPSQTSKQTNSRGPEREETRSEL
jgi:hypothetical protein